MCNLHAQCLSSSNKIKLQLPATSQHKQLSVMLATSTQSCLFFAIEVAECCAELTLQNNLQSLSACCPMVLTCIVSLCSVMVSIKGDTRAHRLPKDTCRFGTDLKFADLQSVKSTKWVNDFVGACNNQMVVNTDRYIFQMSALTAMLSKGPQASFSPQHSFIT